MFSMLFRLITATALIMSPALCTAQEPRETEPNDNPAKANPIKIDSIVKGIVHYGDYDHGDYYKLTLPSAGIVTATLSDFPSDCIMKLGALGFSRYETSAVGYTRGERGKPLTFSFSAQGNKHGYILVSLGEVADSAAGGDWSIAQARKDGDFYHLANPDGKISKDLPSSYNGKRVLQPIQYSVKITLQPLPDPYEPNYFEGESYDALLKKGVIKSIPAGKVISAYLFNEAPYPMRGTTGYEKSGGGGENDVDVYHVVLSKPETVKVTLGEFPAGANSRIIIKDVDGWDESKTGAMTFERRIKKAGDVFIEISRGREDRPLVHSAIPYRLLVTTDSIQAVMTDPVESRPETTSGKQPPAKGILIEAEDEVESNIKPLSERPAQNTEEINPPWRPPYSGYGCWYLAVTGEFLKYKFTTSAEETYYVWIRDYVDRFQARGIREVVVEIDGKSYGTFTENTRDSKGDKGLFAWHRVGDGIKLSAGDHTLKVSKKATTSGAAILDAFYLTADPNDVPEEKLK